MYMYLQNPSPSIFVLFSVQLFKKIFFYISNFYMYIILGQ